MCSFHPFSSCRLFNWLLSMVACWNYTAGYNVFESGDRLEDVVDETFLFLPNHQVIIVIITLISITKVLICKLNLVA